MSDPTDDGTGVPDAGSVYERTKDAFVATVSGLGPEALARPVPATPAWRVRDVLAHVVGLTADLDAQRFPESDDTGGERWNARQVADRSSRPVSELVAEWDREAPVFVEGLRVFGDEFGRHFVADLHAHLQDVRHALGLPRADDPVTVGMALDHYLGFVGERLAELGWGVLEVVTAGVVRTVGAGPHRARVTASPFELVRALSARRSLAQVGALAWEGDAAALLAALPEVYAGGYAFPAVDLVE